ncbi:GntR family transcriptional regulator [Roseomonas sp. NAR14]|uniref:GntR family transcriptional regulator n=1 Tax=Roseomonas acroporae TaxID=2937791 RepID=A0A9X1Y8K5_9PROT|nr:GntR family transcriptional regulator [Roseomonas acroporae]MCK8786139.1 GntR family transcriptional regulator [Roseomonas acroporae]
MLNGARALEAEPPLARRTLGASVHGRLAELLIAGRLAPGERLSLRDTAAALGVSVMPVREAVARLVADGALEVAPNRAVRVPLMPRGRFLALAETRIAVEGLAAARAATARSAAELAAIRRAEAAFRAMAGQARPDLQRAVALNRDVHFRIYEACGLAPLRDIIAGLWLKVGPVLNLDLRSDPARLRQGSALRCHAAALAAIEAGDAAAARAAIVADIEEAAAYIVARGGLAAEDAAPG